MGFLLQRIPQTRRDRHEIKDKQSTCFAWYRSCVSHSAAIFLQTRRTPQECCELLCSSLRGPGRTRLFVQEQWSRKKRSSATARNSKPINTAKQQEHEWHPIEDQQWTRLELWQGCPNYSTKARCCQAKQSIQPTAYLLTLYTFLEGFGSQGPKILPKQSPRLLHSAGEQWAQDTQLGWHRSRGWPQGTTVCTQHFPPLNYHCTLPYFQFNPLPDKPHMRVQTHPPALQRQQPLHSSSWWEHETIRAIKKGMQRKLLCIPLPTSSPRGPAGRQGSASQWMQCLFTAVRETCMPSPPTCTYILWFGFPSPRKAALWRKGKMNNIHTAYYQWCINTLSVAVYPLDLQRVCMRNQIDMKPYHPQLTQMGININTTNTPYPCWRFYYLF